MGQFAEGQPLLAADPAGDAALKANNPSQAERYYQQARNIDNTDSYAVLGLGDAAAARKDNDAAERYYRQALRMDSGNSNAGSRSGPIFTAHSHRRKPRSLSSRFLPASAGALMILNVARLTSNCLPRPNSWRIRGNTPRQQNTAPPSGALARRRLDKRIVSRAISTARASAARRTP